MSVSGDVLLGKHDDELDAIERAARERRATVAKANVASLAPGDKVRFIQSTRPAYLRGLVATFVRSNRERIVVTIDDEHDGTPQHKGRYASELTVPPALVERLG